MDRPHGEKKELIPDTCNCGRGKLHRGFKEYVTKVNGGVLVIKNVPALICDLCDEAYLTPEASREIDKIVKNLPNPASGFDELMKDPVAELLPTLMEDSNKLFMFFCIKKRGKNCRRSNTRITRFF